METGKTDIRNSRLEAIAKILGKSPSKIHSYPEGDRPIQNNTFNEQYGNAVNAVNAMTVQNGLSEEERNAYRQIITSKDETIAAKDDVIDAKNQTIASLQAQLRILSKEE
jgi:hypothetical protein